MEQIKQPPRTNHARVLWLVQTAILTAIIFLMAFTPLGYLKAGVIEISFLMIPVAIGAILIGPTCGLVLGTVFGITSFIQCFGFSAFGAILLGINPFYTFILCMVPRMLMGWLVSVIFRALSGTHSKKTDAPDVAVADDAQAPVQPAARRQPRLIAFILASLSGAVLNTVLFVSGLFLLFGNTDYIKSFGPTMPVIIGLLVGTNAILEAVISLVLGTAITKALYRVVNR